MALEEIEQNKGIHYDADVVDVCLKLFRKRGLGLSKQYVVSSKRYGVRSKK